MNRTTVGRIRREIRDNGLTEDEPVEIATGIYAHINPANMM